MSYSICAGDGQNCSLCPMADTVRLETGNALPPHNLLASHLSAKLQQAIKEKALSPHPLIEIQVWRMVVVKIPSACLGVGVRFTQTFV